MASFSFRTSLGQDAEASAPASADWGLSAHQRETDPSAGKLVFGHAAAALSPSLIPKDWVLKGEPLARALLHSESEDGLASTVVWECTPGAFNWRYGCDESIYIVEGEATLTEAGGLPQRIGPGSVIYCPAGREVRWDVYDTIRKVAIVRRPLPRSASLAIRLTRWVRKLMGRAPRGGGDSPLTSSG